MADMCVPFNDLLTAIGRTQKEYELDKRGEVTAVTLTARHGHDWEYARRWVDTDKVGTRGLYHVLDQVEAAGWRFHVDHDHSRDKEIGEAPGQDAGFRMTTQVAAYSGEERRLHAELFPQEVELLAAGYDWDWNNVYRNGAPIIPDRFGRVIEHIDACVFEWVHVAVEYTWRRYPIETGPAVTVPARGDA